MSMEGYAWYSCIMNSVFKKRATHNGIEKKTRCVCETQMPPIMSNSKYGKGHKDKYLDTSTKILSQDMLMCNTKVLIFYILKCFKISKRRPNRSITGLSLEFSIMWNIKALTLTVQILTRLNFYWKIGKTPRSRSHGQKWKVLSHEILMWNIKAVALTVQMLLALLEFQRERQNDRHADQKQYAPRSRRQNNNFQHS